MCLWRLEAGYATQENAFGNVSARVRLLPFIGCIGTAQSGFASSLDAGPHGGNMDLPDLGPGCTLLLPVVVPGGRLYVGDLHAAQGAGELVGGGMEVSGTVRLRCGLEKGRNLRLPRYYTAEGRGCIATHLTLPDAVNAAFAEMVDWLTEDGFQRYDAYLVLSQTCELRIGGLSRRMATAACYLSHAKYVL
jgi:acetamidase/formamidase